ncbi:MAG TPA: triose-phosphate isomerase [Syntrophales bacterium]|nr:triose-phosphate isomerase [Syntrophales bacterium]HOL58289.1 triose-phosphate isomerase [Syntrophales bacterium]HPO34458.1 triose-phosphate isomerase [Syntrophales bacterium]
MRIPFICGNWKMNKTVKEAQAFARELVLRLPSAIEREVALAPPFVSLYPVAALIKNSPLSLAAQNVHDQPHGAYTGEISAPMLADVGCKFVIVGHSERRTYFGEPNEWVNRKIKAVLASGMYPILCVGETLEEREKGLTFSVIRKQIKEGLQDIDMSGISRTVIAYEPVWAIGTGRTAEPAQAEEVHAFIRQEVETLTSRQVAEALKIIYGGSVNPHNISALMAETDIDGALIGGASLNLDDFLAIVLYE